MKIKVTDVVDIFYDESNQPIGVMIMNGKIEFYKLVSASKDFIREELLEVQNNLKNHASPEA